MPPSARRKLSSSTPATDIGPSSSKGNQQLQKVRKAARLIGMVNGLQKSMEAIIDNRKYFSQRSSDLEQALTESAPEALTKSINMRTIQVADIMMELEDLTEKNATFEERLHILQHGHERDKQNMQKRLDQLQSEYNLLDEKSQAKQQDLEEKLKKAIEESAELHNKYTTIRKNYHSCTNNIAIMASKIASVQRENNSLRLEADESHRALVGIEKKMRLLREKEKAALESIDSGESKTWTTLQSQLEAANIENEKLEAESRAREPGTEELQEPNSESQMDNIIADTPISDRVTPAPMAEAASVPEPTLRALTKKTQQQLHEWNQDSRLDGLLSIVKSMSGHISCGSADLLASTSSESKIQIFEDNSVNTDPESPVVIKKETQKSARRMKISINGMDGAYTGPLGWNGLPNGTGTIRFKNGDTYLGDLRDGKLHGKGAMYYGAKDKTTIRGFYENNALVDRT